MKNRNLTFVAVLCLLSSYMFAQEDMGSALPMTTYYYFAYYTDGVTPPLTSGSLGVSGSGVPACQGIDNNDVWYEYTSIYNGNRIDVDASFDAVISIYDSSMNLIDCENSIAGAGVESIWVNQLTANDTYYLRIHSFGAETGTFDIYAYHLPPCGLRAGWYPYPATDGIPVGYRVNESTKRRNYAADNIYIQATMWEFTDVNSGFVETVIINGTNGDFALQQLTDMCFGNEYTVRVQIQLEGKWSGFGEPRPLIMELEPSTRLLPGYGGGTYGISSNLKVVFTGAQQIIEWRFTTDNGAEVINHISTNSTISMDDIDCIRYNRIYTVEVRATYCGITGPWSTPDFIIIAPIPYTQLIPEDCGTVQFPGATLQCEFVNVADQYAWQIAPVDPSNPLIPIGPAIVELTPNATLYLLPLGLDYGTTYRVGIKPMLGFTGGCATTQEGDYGQFCLVTIGNPNTTLPPVAAPNIDIEDGGIAVIDGDFQQMQVYPNPVQSGQTFNVTFDASGYSDQASIAVYNMGGQVILDEKIWKRYNGRGLEIMSDDRWTPGLYHIQIIDNRKSMNSKILVK